MAIALFSGSYGLSAANFRVRIVEVSTGDPAVITLQDGTVVNSDGDAQIDSYGNLAIYLDTSKTYGVHLNQYLLPSTDTSVATIIMRSPLQLASAPSIADIELGAGATFVDNTNPSKTYRISNDGEMFMQVGAPDGVELINGLSNALIFLYQRGTSAPVLPDLNVTYTFTTRTVTGVSHGWLPSVPAGTDPIWVTSATASSTATTDVITPGEWVTPVIFSQNGINSSTVQLFQRTGSSTPPSVPDVPVIYTFATGIASGLDNGWTQSLPTSGGGFRWTTTGTALATGGISTDIINPSEWAPVSLLAQDGANGPAGMNSTTVYAYQRSASSPTLPSATTTFTFSTNTITGLNNGWVSAPTSGSSPLYVTVASATSATDTDTIAPGEWATPVVLVQNGADGTSLNTASIYLYQRTTTSSAPSLPSAAVTYTFSTATATGVDNGWTQTLPTTGGGYRWLTTATALSSGNTDLILPVEWATAALLAEDGQAGTPGAPGAAGTAGSNGLNNAVVFVYQRSATGAPAVPSATITYTFATAAITGLAGGWTASLPSGTDPIYVTSATASSATSSDTIATNEWASPIVLAANGTNGINSATVYLFQRTGTSTPPSVPSGTITYTFATGVAAGITNGWSQTVPSTGGAFRWVTTATALGSGATDSVLASEWATPAILAQDGSTGAAGLNNAIVFLYQRLPTVPSVPSTTVTYTFATAIATGFNNGWAINIPAGTDPLYVTSAPASSTGTTDTIATNEWASPVVLALDGAAGLNSATVYLFQRTSTGVAPALPTGTVTYTFTSGIASGLNNGWTQSMPTTGGSFRWMSLATALGTGATDTIPSTEWVAAALISQDGVNGTNGTNGQRGSQTFNVALSGSTNTYSDSLATTTASANGGPILNDIVTQYNTSVGFSQTKYWNGTGWTLITQVIDGSLLVTNSVSTPALAANAVTAINMAADAVTAKSLALTDLSNLVPNPSGFNGTTASADGWSTTSAFPVTAGFGAYYTLGVNEYTIVVTGRDNFASTWFPVKPGDQFYLEYTSKPSTTADFDLCLGLQYGTTSPGTSVFFHSGPTRTVAGNPTGVLTSSGSLTVPATYTWCRVWIQVVVSPSSASNGWCMKNLVVRRKNGASLIVDGSISAQQISASAGITANQINSNGLSIRDTSGNLILSAGSPLAAQITSGSGNLYQNTEFALASAGIPTGFAIYNSSSIPVTSTVTSGGGATADANVWKLAWGGTATGNTGYFLSGGWPGNWRNNTDYVWSFYAKADTGNFILGSTMTLAWNHNPIVGTWLKNPPLTTNWQSYVVAINFGNSTLDVNGFVFLTTPPHSGDNLYVSCIQVERGTSPSGWAPLQYIDANGIAQGNPSGSASTAVSNSVIQLGGRNLVTRAAMLAAGGSSTTDYYGQQNAISIAVASGTNYRVSPFTQHDQGFYSVSFWIKTSITTNVEFDICDQAPSSSIACNTTWQFIKYEGLFINSSFLTGAPFGFCDWNPTSACTIYISNLMVETGNKSSIWIPAPEDGLSKDLSNAPGAILNSSVTIGSNGTLNNAGGGQVTITGLGYNGALNATSDLNLVARGSCVVVGNSISKPTGSAAWDSDAYSAESFTGGAFASVTVPNVSTSSFMFGLNTDPLTDQSYASLDYAFYIAGSSGWYIWESGNNILGPFSSANNDVFYITYDGSVVTYYYNGVNVRQVAAAANIKFSFDSSFNTVGSACTTCRFGPLTNLGATVVAIADKISKSTSSILSSTVSINAVSGAGFVAGNLTWDSAGVRTGGHGVAMTPGGLLGTNSSGTSTFSLDAATGNAFFGGTLAVGVASKGVVSTSLSNSSTTQPGGATSISSGAVTCQTYTTSSKDMLLAFNVNVQCTTNTNTPLEIQFFAFIDGSAYSPAGMVPRYELTQSNAKMSLFTGITLYNWGSTNNFTPTFIIPSGAFGAGSHTFGYGVSISFLTASGGPNTITGSSLFTQGMITIREFT